MACVEQNQPASVESHISLSDFLRQVSRAIKQALPDSCWVVAELSDFKLRANGHAYLEILEFDEGKEVAKAKATMFSSVAGRILGEWKRVTGGLPQAGMKVLVKVRADLSPQYGMALS